MTRQIVLDTETTGLSPQQGHRIIEIGCVEIMHRRLTGNSFHVYLQPDREVEQGAIQVHGITNDFLKDKPRFHDIKDEFKDFIRGAELIIHNAPFDTGFIENEFLLLSDKEWHCLENHCQIIDTLVLARRKHPGQRNNLDALCKRYSVDNLHRKKHGALLDAEILAEIYLAMTGGQNLLILEETTNTIDLAFEETKISLEEQIVPLSIASEQELLAHTAFLKEMEKKYGVTSVWRTLFNEEDALS